jgi:hypothetical protein
MYSFSHSWGARVAIYCCKRSRMTSLSSLSMPKLINLFECQFSKSLSALSMEHKYFPHCAGGWSSRIHCALMVAAEAQNFIYISTGGAHHIWEVMHRRNLKKRGNKILNKNPTPVLRFSEKHRNSALTYSV